MCQRRGNRKLLASRFFYATHNRNYFSGHEIISIPKKIRKFVLDTICR